MGDYDYANARLRVLKGQLLDSRAYLDLAALTRVEDLIARLAQSAYGDEVKIALARFGGPRVVMEACRLHLANAYRKIRAFFDEEGARLVGILLARWDLFNLKTILRGQEAGARPEEIVEALVPAGILDESALRQLVRQPDPIATVDLLRTWNIGYAVAMRRVVTEFAAAHDWSVLETALDTVFYRQLLSSLQKDDENDDLVREFLARQIDGANVMTALRLRQVSPTLGEADLVRRLLSGGQIAREGLMNLAHAARDEEAVALLRASGFGPAISALDTLDIGKTERALDRDLVRFGVAFFARDPLTIATAIGFVTAKSVEATNLRVIAQGIALGLGRTAIENELILQ